MPPKWPHDHSAKHAAAARLGWQHRRERLQEPVKSAPVKATKQAQAAKTKGAKKVEKRTGYEQWKADYERLIRNMNNSATPEEHMSAMRQLSGFGLQHPGYSKRYREEQGIKLPGDDQKKQRKRTMSNEEKRSKIISLENQQRALRAEIAELQKQYVRDLRPDGEHRAASVAIHSIGPQMQRKMRQLEAVQTRLHKARG